MNSIAQNGTAIHGYYTTLYQKGKVIATGYTPVSFTLTNGLSYQIETHNYGNEAFDYWADSGNATQLRTISINSNTTLSCSVQGNGREYSSFWRFVHISNGTQISGYYTTLWQNNKVIASGFTPYTFTVACCKTYAVEVSDYNDFMFIHWGDGNTSRLQTVIPTNQGTVVMTASYQTGITISPQAAVFEPSYGRNIPMVVTNLLRYSVNLTGINSLNSGSAYVTAKLSSKLPLRVPSSGSAVFNLNVSVSSSVPFDQYNITAIAEFDSTPSFSISFLQSILIGERYINSDLVSMAGRNSFQNKISAANQTQVSQSLGQASNFTLTQPSSPSMKSTNVTVFSNDQFRTIKATPVVLVNQTTSSSQFLVSNMSWTSILQNGTRKSGYNYTLTLVQNYSQYTVTVSAAFGTCGCAQFNLGWTSNALTILHLGDYIEITNVTNVEQFFNGLYYAVSSLSQYYSSSTNQTLQTLGQRYGQVLPSLNYTMNNLPSSLKNLAVTSGAGTISDSWWSCFLCLLEIQIAVITAAAAAIAAICIASFFFPILIPLCIFILDIVTAVPILVPIFANFIAHQYCYGNGSC